MSEAHFFRGHHYRAVGLSSQQVSSACAGQALYPDFYIPDSYRCENGGNPLSVGRCKHALLIFPQPIPCREKGHQAPGRYHTGGRSQEARDDIFILESMGDKSPRSGLNSPLNKWLQHGCLSCWLPVLLVSPPRSDEAQWPQELGAGPGGAAPSLQCW